MMQRYSTITKKQKKLYHFFINSGSPMQTTKLSALYHLPTM